MDRRTKEAVRYLGYGKHAADEQTLSLIKNSFAELEEAVSTRFVYRIFELQSDDAEYLQIGTLKIKSSHLARNLKDCTQAVIFCATLGTGVDMLLRRYSVTDMAQAVVMQACAAAMLEEACDSRQEELAAEFKKEGKYLRPRFSPGYGDFSIEHQADILKLLNASKEIGLFVTDGGMLAPLKSVTAVIGVSRKEAPCHVNGCERCEKTDCSYRR